MLETSTQKTPRVKRRNLQQTDLSRIQKQLEGRQHTLQKQRRQYAKRWLVAKTSVDDEFKRRLNELKALQIAPHKHLDALRRSCDFRVQTLKNQLQRDIELVRSLQSLKVVERDAQKMLELVKCASKPPVLSILPNLKFKDQHFEVVLSDMWFGGLGELIGETGHRCFSSDIAELVASYITTTHKFKGERYVEYKGQNKDSVFHVVGLSGDRVATGGRDSIRVWDSQSGKQLQLLKIELFTIKEGSFVSSLAAVDEDRILSGSLDSVLRLWDLQTGQCIRTFQGHIKAINCVCIFTDSKGVLRVVSGGDDKTIRIWDIDTGVCILVLRGHEGWVNCVSAFTDDSQRLVSGSADKTVRVWNTKTGKCLQMLEEHSRVTSVLILRDQKRMVSASWDRTLRICNIETGECLRILKGHSSHIYSISAFADGQHIISGGEDQTMRVWDVDTGECINVIKTKSEVWGVCCLEGERVVSVSKNARVQVWN